MSENPADPAFWEDLTDDDAEPGPTYEIVRFYQDRGTPPEVLETGLTLAEAQEHCNDPETSSRTATSPEADARTEMFGSWFDGYREE